MPATQARRSPRTKEELLNRMMSFDFTGNIREIGNNTIVERTKKNAVSLTFPDTGATYFLTVHKPRPEKTGKVAKSGQRLGGDADQGETENTGTRRARPKARGAKGRTRRAS